MRNPNRFGITALAWQGIYLLTHVWWAVDGAPLDLEHDESYFPGGWFPVAIAAVAVVGTGAVVVGAYRELDDIGHYLIAAINAIAGIALCVYSFLFPVVLVSILFEVVTRDDVARLLVTGSGVAGGVLCLLLAVRERRAAARPCE
jgi:cytochrome bd-type quinol oxidase subunit 2